METKPFVLTRKHKIYGSGGLLAMAAVVSYEVYKLHRRFDTFVARNLGVLDIDKKRPDYIYINYSIYKASLEQLRKKEQEANIWKNRYNPFLKWWKGIKHSIAWRLLEMAQSAEHEDRLKAVYQLSKITHLKDWDFQHLAQLCDARTAISLARSECDLRWFLTPSKCGIKKSPSHLFFDLKNILQKLKPHGVCVKHFETRIFTTIGTTPSPQKGEYLRPTERISKSDIENLKLCVEMFLHLSTYKSFAQSIIETGGLSSLFEMQKIFNGHTEMKFRLAKTIANMSLCRDLLEDFFVTGWVGVLARWSRDPDMRLQAIANKALHNLDIEESNCFYEPKIYPLYPQQRMKWKPDLDIVFIHGLLGGVFITWRQKDRQTTDLGLYGKNAFYGYSIDEALDDKNINRNASPATPPHDTNFALNRKETITNQDSSVAFLKSKKMKMLTEKAARDILGTFQTPGELNSDWEVVSGDVPMSANATASGSYSVPGDEWMKDDQSDEYTHCWPMDWLPQDFPHIRVIGINYESALSQWMRTDCPCLKSKGIDARSEELLERLAHAKVGEDRPVVWIGHSMGGLLAKSVIVKALDSAETAVQAVGQNTRAIMFLGTPHKGSPFARMKQHVQLIFSPSIEVVEMEENSKNLLALHDRFLARLVERCDSIEVVSIAEGAPTTLTSFKFPLHIVTEHSAQIGVGDFYVLNADHLSLSKPILRQSFLYRRILQMIATALKPSPTQCDKTENQSK